MPVFGDFVFGVPVFGDLGDFGVPVFGDFVFGVPVFGDFGDFGVPVFGDFLFFACLRSRAFNELSDESSG